MPHPILRSAIACIGLVLLVLGTVWALGGYEALGFVGGVALTLGIIVAATVSIGLMLIIRYGRRSRRDEAIRRLARHHD